jgi:small multidrug resistance pump
MAYVLLAIAIVAEVIATTALKSADGFTRLWPTLTVAVGYGLAFFLLSLALRQLSLGFTYAVWSGLGIVLAATAGIVFYGERIDLAGALGLAMIIGGVVVLNTVSSMSGH